MEVLHPLSTSEWLEQASAALKSGDSARAYECAMAAARQDPLCEQAWLILASVSEPEKAMLYLENALRANPRSQAARKAVRLVFSRLNAADSAGTPDEPGEEPNPAFVDVQTPLEEEEPILEKPAEKVEEDTSEKSQSMQENLPQVAKIPAVSPEKTAGALRLRKRSEPVALSPTSRGRKFKLVRKTKPASVFPESPAEPFAGQPAVELGASPIIEAAVEPPAISPELAAAGANEPDSIQTPPNVVEVEQSPSPEMPAGQHPSPAKAKRSRKPAPLSAPEQLPAHPKKQRAQKKAADRPVIMPDSAFASTPRGFHELKKTEPADVDMIELVLVSIAAIVLPLIVFLYFYLSR
ncbi:MAG: hypothetical protein HPY72_10695 [Anaerolineae bacterium]|nr:hypothetical protein [Anaerolineae bacterium]